jgi:biopolymer transport protein ExbD
MSFTRTARRGYSTDYGWRPPTTFVDVLFLILTFFISIAAVREQEATIDVSLPATETARSGTRTQIVITVTQDGAIYMAEQAYTLETLGATLRKLAQDFPGESVIIRGDRNSRLGVAVKVMDLAYQVGLRNVYLATTKSAGEI